MVMTANKFVKKFGWEEANSFVNWYGGKTSFKFLKVKGQTISVHSGDQPYDFHIDALKRIVESHELVESFGGLKMAKESLKNLPSEYQSYTMTRDDTGATTQSFKLYQAIFDVESCQ